MWLVMTSLNATLAINDYLVHTLAQMQLVSSYSTDHFIRYVNSVEFK